MKISFWIVLAFLMASTSVWALSEKHPLTSRVKLRTAKRTTKRISVTPTTRQLYGEKGTFKGSVKIAAVSRSVMGW